MQNAVATTSQLADAILHAQQLEQEVLGVMARVKGELSGSGDVRQQRLNVARGEWNLELDALQSACGAQLREADELLELQREEAERKRLEEH